MKKRQNPERKEQIKFFNILKKYYPVIDSVTTAIECKALRNPIQANLMKLSGVKSGMPDIFCFFANGGYHGLFIEMKEPGKKNSKNGGLSPSQKARISSLSEQGYCVCVCYSASEAFNAITKYWNFPNRSL